jgi:uncharacterized RDD family membrane protein YckC
MLCRNHVDVSEGVRRCARCGATFCSDCLVDIAGKPYCATCKTEELLDVRSGVSSTVLDIASIGKRIGAYLIDTFILYIVNFGIGIGLGIALAATHHTSAAGCSGAIMGIVVTVVYDALFTAARGQSPGKMAVGIMVVSEDGTRVTTGQAWGRAFAKLIPFAVLVAFFNEERKGIHDSLAHTRVVNRPCSPRPIPDCRSRRSTTARAARAAIRS